MMLEDLSLLFTGVPALAEGLRFGTSTVALCRKGGRLIMFDTGPYACRPMLISQLASRGVRPEDIDTLVLSHLHWDHAENADLFANAKVIVHEDELRYAEHPAPTDWATPPYLMSAIRRLRLEPTKGEPEIAPGLKVVDLPGHTPGLIGLLVDDWLLASDAILGGNSVVSRSLVLWFHDPDLATRSIDKALQMASVMVPGHDRPLRPGPPVTYLGGFNLRLRFFAEPGGQDQEITIACDEA